MTGKTQGLGAPRWPDVLLPAAPTVQVNKNLELVTEEIRSKNSETFVTRPTFPAYLTAMTLISLTANFGYPIILGDILTSSEETDTELAIPTFLQGVNHRLPAGQKLLPFKLRQKIYIIKEQLAVALAGSEYEMKFFLEELKNNFKYRELTLTNLEAFLSDFDYEQVQQSAAIMLFAEQTAAGILLHERHIGAWREGPSPLYQHVFACGSGSEQFMNEAGVAMHTHGEGGTGLNQAISFNYILLAKLLVQERTTLETIKKHWGAGFEMIYYDGTKFTKMDDVTYVIWKGKLDLQTGAHEEQPFLILNFKYYGEVLAITATDCTKTEGYGVLPIYMKKEDVDPTQLPSKPHIDGKRMCSIYLLELSNGHTVTPAFFTEKAAEPGFVTFNATPNESDDALAGLFTDGKMMDPGVITVKFDQDGRLCILINTQIQDFLMEMMRQSLIATYGTESLSKAP